MAGMFEGIRTSMGFQANNLEVAQENPTLLQQWQTDVGQASKLTTQQRIAGFGVSVLLTLVCWTLVRTSSAKSCTLYAFLAEFIAGRACRAHFR
jgi:hypothetical protein